MQKMSKILLLLNCIAFFLMFYDKRQARRGKWRVPENSLLFLAVLGGSVGVWLGMKGFRHKTKHQLFYRGIPLLIFLQGALCFCYFRH
ncbi:MAG TPA: DUF1294 domain-containing protein [Firmicutes bacterium]|jgi:uncharacterized membrane protein YsdA (DUF1294 family)|nr:DUF1294 domain-containing protein [Bacillota bacterium]HAA37277.1 DUF1294 domain-containing protein [Bacillota bacterium]